MEIAIKLFQFILSISILVLLHELGHFLPAIWFKTRAEKFFLFFDPYFSIFSMKKINGKWQYKFLSKNLPDSEVIEVNGKKEEVPIDISKLPDSDWRKHPEQTKYGIGWLPFGGYVKIAGMVDESMDTAQMKKPAEQDGKFYNRMYFVKPDGEMSYYDKRHLFSFSGEDKEYTPGKERVIVEYQGIRFLLQVCYDLRFPVFARNNDDYDAVLYVANWPEKRVEAWEHLLKARAIENLSFVFGLNRIGTDGNNLFYQESSHCFFADGKEISQKQGNIVSAELNMDELKDFRTHFQFLNDRDSFSIKF